MMENDTTGGNEQYWLSDVRIRMTLELMLSMTLKNNLQNTGEMGRERRLLGRAQCGSTTSDGNLHKQVSDVALL